MNVVNSDGTLGETSPTQTNAQNAEKFKKKREGASSLTFGNAIAPGCLLAYFYPVIFRKEV